MFSYSYSGLAREEGIDRDPSQTDDQYQSQPDHSLNDEWQAAQHLPDGIEHRLIENERGRKPQPQNRKNGKCANVDDHVHFQVLLSLSLAEAKKRLPCQ